ncbi:hypothetical protein MBSD_n0230 [Mizugakiibacter sediminis]|uniref:Transmembrane protein n=1 Tax=Mizugakiibacter sediminis TaxID=1475481 RepID=A0A0K8QKD2_9GAMM|nr:hypothetical protein [Mizugakiibacter sediminis]GAP64947.1 hypothetical protein MBSD_n0230 [Mizugakiibacter sediminis]
MSARLSVRQYQWRVLAAMVVYVLVMVLAWPLVRETASLPLKVALALLPVLPMLYVIALMAQRVLRSDELEQRTHLVALGVATLVTGTLSLIGGFLAIARVLPLDGSTLIFVFPLLMTSYGLARGWVVRRYGGDALCEDDGMPLHRRFFLTAALIAAIGLYAWWRDKAFALGVCVGIAAVFALSAVALMLRRARRGDGAAR